MDENLNICKVSVKIQGENHSEKTWKKKRAHRLTEGQKKKEKWLRNERTGRDLYWFSILLPSKHHFIHKRGCFSIQDKFKQKSIPSTTGPFLPLHSTFQINPW